MTDTGNRQPKVDRVIERYDLEGLDDSLGDYWTRETDSFSLRELADYFNKQVLRSSLEAEGMRLLDGEVETYYQILTESESNPSERQQLRRTLEREGIDVEEVQNDFITHQTVHNYLRDHRRINRNQEKSSKQQRQTVKERIDRLQGRTEAVVTDNLQTLARNDQLPIENFDTIVNIRIMDTSTGETFDIKQLLEDGD